MLKNSHGSAFGCCWHTVLFITPSFWQDVFSPLSLFCLMDNDWFIQFNLDKEAIEKQLPYWHSELMARLAQVTREVKQRSLCCGETEEWCRFLKMIVFHVIICMLEHILSVFRTRQLLTIILLLIVEGVCAVLSWVWGQSQSTNNVSWKSGHDSAFHNIWQFWHAVSNVCLSIWVYFYLYLKM